MFNSFAALQRSTILFKFQLFSWIKNNKNNYDYQKYFIIYAYKNARFKRTFSSGVLIDINNSRIPIIQQR